MKANILEWQDEMNKLRTKLVAAEQARLSGQSAISIDESQKRLETIYGNEE